MKLEKDVEVLHREYTEAARNAARALRKAATELDSGEVPLTSVLRPLDDTMNELSNAFLRLGGALQRAGVKIDPSMAVTQMMDRFGGSYAGRADKPQESATELLRSVQLISSEDPAYRDALKPILDRAHDAEAGLSSGASDELTEDQKQSISEAEAVLAALSGRPEMDEVFRSLGIDPAVLVGILLGKYTKQDAEDQEQTPDEKKTSIEPSSSLVAALPNAEGGLQPAGRLKQRTPNARSLLKVFRSRHGTRVALILSIMLSRKAATTDQVAALIEASFDIPADLLQPVLEETMRYMLKQGMLGSYVLEGEVVYLLTDYTIQSIQMKKVVEALDVWLPDTALTIDSSDVFTAKPVIEKSDLLSLWAYSELETRYAKWLRTNFDIVMMVDDHGPRYATFNGLVVDLPRRAGGGRYLLRPYEFPLIQSEFPLLLVSVGIHAQLNDTERGIPEGSLLIKDNMLYEWCDDQWTERKDNKRSNKKTGRKRRKR